MLLREMMSDPFLDHYGVIIIDQAHERTVSTDVLLGLLKDILLQRPELRVVVLAIPPLTDKLLSHYGSIPLISLEASSPAEVVHSHSSNKDYFYSALRLVLEIHRTKEDGDVVVFFASAEVRDDCIFHEWCHRTKAWTGLTNAVPSCFACNSLLQEVHCAHSILQREGTRLGAELGQMVPVVLCPGHVGLLPVPTKQPGSKRSRRVFLSTQQGEDMWWPTESVNFVIDTGVQKRLASYFLQNIST